MVRRKSTFREVCPFPQLRLSVTYFSLYRGNVHHFTVGAGEGQFGLWLDSSLCQGRTQACSTYNNPPLVEAGDFVVKTIECWAFD